MSAQLDMTRVLAGRARLADDAVGTLVHAVLAELLAEGRPLTSQSATDVADRLLPPDIASVYRQSLRQRAISAVVRYEQNFRMPEWNFAVSESVAGDVRLDLVFSSAGGRIYADEIKTGTGALSQLHSIRMQAKSQLAEGITTYGSRFAGVRIVLLAANRSVFVSRESVEPQ